ncbi:metallo-beta-lactamase domain-containing protein 1 [Ctenocephalides felis]|uniref:metallo-beta-lactamase domain-containing protein 1 n=1 Tax=Ctenocephalides felis TaxID=7515 RepID=UPI000E6E57E1|nr:metallo-beta-lactamase domain-containing protein 1 [Ctenocephalides felis]
MSYEVHVLSNGYSVDEQNHMLANCTCTLILGPINIIVDTMTSWDKEVILNGLAKHKLTPSDINYVICTHGHSDHIGNNNLFLESKLIVGFCVSFKNKYEYFPFKEGKEFIINDNIKVIPTPGHTLQDVTVIVTTDDDVIAITGDLFEKEEDIENPSLWLSSGSDDPKLQKYHRRQIIDMSTYIIPGHGPKFKVTDKQRAIIDLSSDA